MEDSDDLGSFVCLVLWNEGVFWRIRGRLLVSETGVPSSLQS